MIVQAIADFCGFFMDVYIGWPGGLHNTLLFANSSLNRKGMHAGYSISWLEENYTGSFEYIILLMFPQRVSCGIINYSWKPCPFFSAMVNRAISRQL